MLYANMKWVSMLLWACVGMLGPMGQPVDKRKDMETAVSQNEKHYVRQSQSLSDAEQEFVLKRKHVALKFLNSLGMDCTLDSVPHVALLGSGGGQRAAVGLMGFLYQMEKESLLDTLLYLGGVSGSAWSMSSLYSDPQWSSNMDGAVSRLSGPGVGPEQALAWLVQRSKEEHFSLTDIWGVMTSAGIMKQLNLRRLSDDGTNALNPYPIYNAVDKNCLRNGSEKDRWFEMTPHEVGFTDLGLFTNTSFLDSRIHEAGDRPEMDMVRVEGIVGSTIADEHELVNYVPDWLKGLVGGATSNETNLLDVVSLWTEVPQRVNGFLDVLDRYMRGYHSLLRLTELIRRNTDDPTVLSGLDTLQKTLKESLNLNPAASFKKTSPDQQKLILEQWRQSLAPLETLIQSLDETPIQKNVSSLMKKVFHLIWKWQWGTTENFLYQHRGSAVPPCIRHKQHLQLIDASTMLSVPFPPFLGEKRDTDLLIVVECGSYAPFRSLFQARDYAATVRKPFPEIDDKVLEDRAWPKDFYVFEGKEKEPTIIYMPLFNRNNSKDAKEFEARMEEFATFQLPFSQEKIEFLLETAKANVRNNKDTLLREVHRAAVRRHGRRFPAETASQKH